MRLYFVRHGESEANLAREFSNQGFKHPLTPRGVTQATELAARLAGQGIAQIYTSPLQRAVQTAEILAEAWDLPVIVADALREWDVGGYEGTSDPRGWELHRWVQEEWFVHRRLDQRMPGGESFRDIAARFVPFLDQLVRAPGQEALLLVGHGGLYHAMLPAVLANIDYALVERRPMSPTDYVLAETSAAGLSCRMWCGVALSLGEG